MWELVGRKFLELYTVDDCEDNVNLLRIKFLDNPYLPKQVEQFHCFIKHNGKTKRSYIRPLIKDSSLYLTVELYDDAIVEEHFICKVKMVHIDDLIK